MLLFSFFSYLSGCGTGIGDDEDSVPYPLSRRLRLPWILLTRLPARIQRF